MTDPNAEGALSGTPGASHDFLESTFDPVSERLSLDKRGVFWEAVGAAALRAVDRPVHSRIVAVIDSGFDRTVERLSSAAHEKSQFSTSGSNRHGRHGTAVALLINEIAPTARLLLLDVMPTSRLWKSNVAEAVRQAAECGAEIVNLSLEFPSQASRRLLGPLGHEWDQRMSRAAVVDDVRRHFRALDAYSSDGCPALCELCDAIRALPNETVVFAASGNTESYSCPACIRRTVGVAFHNEFLVDSGDYVMSGQSVGDSLPENLTWEVSVPAPPGFVGTSFAAPLMAGLAAITEDRQMFAEMIRFPFGLTPVATLANYLRDNGLLEPALVDAWADGLDEFVRFCPAEHRHWEESQALPCPTCAFSMIDFYNQVIILRMVLRNLSHAVEFGETAIRLAPFSASAAGNLSEAYLRSAAACPEGSPERRRLAEAALLHAGRAHEFAPDVDLYAQQLVKATAEVNASG